MTGAETKRQVMEALAYLYHRTPLQGENLEARGRSESWEAASAALAPCIVLTEEEAAELRSLVIDRAPEDRLARLLALLTPPAPGEEEK